LSLLDGMSLSPFARASVQFLYGACGSGAAIAGAAEPMTITPNVEAASKLSARVTVLPFAFIKSRYIPVTLARATRPAKSMTENRAFSPFLLVTANDDD
jgi:hypothetical protein